MQIDQSEESPLVAKPDSIQQSHYSPKSKPFALYSSLPYYGTIIIYIMGLIAFECFSNNWFAIFVIFGLLPVLDFLVPKDWLNPTKQQERELENKISFKIPLYLTILFDWHILLKVVGDLKNDDHIDLLKLSGQIFSVSISSSINFMSSHELIHKHDFMGRFVGCFTLIKSFYMHFYIEHLYGHHRNVGTPKDPATSRLNESFYQFFPRTVIGSWKSAWHYEKRRLLEVEGFRSHIVPQNRMLWYITCYLILPILIYLYGGFLGLLVLFVSAFISAAYFEGINYIEHYGLERKQIGEDAWEKVDIRHSWNAPHRMTNYFLFKLQRHSDHHENSYKPYQTLASYDESPQLPNGYALCIMMAFYPPLWFKVMNPLVEYYRKGVKPDPIITKENVQSMWNYTFVIAAIFGSLSFMQFAQLSLSKFA